MAGTCAGSLIAELFAEIALLRNDGILATTDLELVAIRIFEKECVIAGAIVLADFWAFEILTAVFAHHLRDFIDFVTRLSPESNPGSIGLVMSIFGEAEKFRGLVAGAIKCSPRFVRPIAPKPELRQQFSVKAHRPAKVFDSQINVIKPSDFHF
jgi:hypothetical protein